VPRASGVCASICCRSSSCVLLCGGDVSVVCVMHDLSLYSLHSICGFSLRACNYDFRPSLVLLVTLLKFSD
jgi:hypothetical protein